MKSKIYTQSKLPLDKNQSLEFCQSSVKQSHFQNLKEKRQGFFDHSSTLSIYNKFPLFTFLTNDIRIAPKRRFLNIFENLSFRIFKNLYCSFL